LNLPSVVLPGNGGAKAIQDPGGASLLETRRKPLNDSDQIVAAM